MSKLNHKKTGCRIDLLKCLREESEGRERDRQRQRETETETERDRQTESAQLTKYVDTSKFCQRLSFWPRPEGSVVSVSDS